MNRECKDCCPGCNILGIDTGFATKPINKHGYCDNCQKYIDSSFKTKAWMNTISLFLGVITFFIFIIVVITIFIIGLVSLG